MIFFFKFLFSSHVSLLLFKINVFWNEWNSTQTWNDLREKAWVLFIFANSSKFYKIFCLCHLLFFLGFYSIINYLSSFSSILRTCHHNRAILTLKLKKIEHSSQNFIFLIIYLIILFKTLNENIMKANKKINKLLFVTQNLVIIINGHANFVHIFTKLGSWYHWVFDFFTLQIVYLWIFNFLCIEIQLKKKLLSK